MNVNNPTRLYGIDYFNTIPINNRYLIDHHKGGNTVELQILNENKIDVDNVSATCEILANYLLSINSCDEYIASNLYTGMASDSNLLIRGLSNDTINICNSLSLNDNTKKEILNSIKRPTNYQLELYSRIRHNIINNISIYTIEVSNEKDINKLKHFIFDKKINLKDNEDVSIFLIKCNNKVIARPRSRDNIDILSIAMKYNRCGPPNRCRAYFYDKDINEVAELLLLEIGNNKSLKKLR